MAKVKNLILTNKPHLAIIISSPSGAGKTTVTKKLISLYKNSYLSISCTTREKRPGEENGKDYFFIKKDDFKKKITQKKFIEYAKVHNNYYGTLKSEVFKNLKKRKIVFFDVDWQGARILKKKLKCFCYSIFLLPPTISALKLRLLKRHKYNSELAFGRFKCAKRDISHFNEYDYLAVNKNLNKCVEDLFKKINQLIRDRNSATITKKLAKKLLSSKQI